MASDRLPVNANLAVRSADCNDNGGAYPDSLQTILQDEDLSSDVFVSPYSSDTPATEGIELNGMGAAVAKVSRKPKAGDWMA